MFWYTSDDENKVAINWVSSQQSVSGYYGGNLSNIPGDPKSPYTTVLGWIESTIPVFKDNYSNAVDDLNTLTIIIEDELSKSSSFEETVSRQYGFLIKGSHLKLTVG